MTKIRIFEDHKDKVDFYRLTLTDILIDRGYEESDVHVDTYSDLQEWEEYEPEPLSGINIIDINLGPGKETEGIDILKKVQDKSIGSKNIVITAYPHFKSTVERMGGIYLTKAVRAQSLRAQIKEIEYHVKNFLDNYEVQFSAESEIIRDYRFKTDLYVDLSIYDYWVKEKRDSDSADLDSGEKSNSLPIFKEAVYSSLSNWASEIRRIESRIVLEINDIQKNELKRKLSKLAGLMETLGKAVESIVGARANAEELLSFNNQHAESQLWDQKDVIQKLFKDSIQNQFPSSRSIISSYEEEISYGWDTILRDDERKRFFFVAALNSLVENIRITFNKNESAQNYFEAEKVNELKVNCIVFDEKIVENGKFLLNVLMVDNLLPFRMNDIPYKNLVFDFRRYNEIVGRGNGLLPNLREIVEDNLGGKAYCLSLGDYSIFGFTMPYSPNQ